MDRLKWNRITQIRWPLLMMMVLVLLGKPQPLQSQSIQHTDAWIIETQEEWLANLGDAP